MIPNEKMTATKDGDFGLFLIGMRFNLPCKVHRWLPVVRSMDHLLAYSKNRNAVYLPAWQAYHQRLKACGSVGIWYGAGR